MAAFEIKTNLPLLGKKLNEVFQRFPKVMDARVGNAGKRTQILLFRKTPKDTGRLARGWFTEKEKLFVWKVDTKVPYADGVELGTGLFATKGRRERIRPKRKKFLKFLDRGQPYNLRKTNFGGGPTFFIARSVKGQKPQFIVKNTTALANRILTQEILKGLKTIADRINRLKARVK